MTPQILIILFTLLINVQLNSGFNHKLVLRYQLQQNNISLPEQSINVNISKHCDINKNKCIWKCCPFGEAVIGRRNCAPTTLDLFTTSNAIIYDSNLMLTNKTLRNNFQFVPNLFSNKIFRQESIDVNIFFNPYFSEDGNLYVELPNVYDRWTVFNHNQFCIDLRRTKKRRIFKIKFFADFSSFDLDVDDNDFGLHLYMFFTLLLCSITLTLILLVYSLVPHLRNLNGWIVKAFITSLVVMFTGECILTAMRIEIYGFKIIIISHYFCNVASYCWTNIMFYDVWISLRNQSNAERTRKEEYKTFIKYCAHGFGLPLVMTVAVVMLDVVDLRHIPWFVTPKLYSSGIRGGVEQIFYAFIPGLILMPFNVYFGIRAISIIHQEDHIISTEKKYGAQSKRLGKCMKVMALLIIEILIKTLVILKPKMDKYRMSFTYNFIMGFAILVIFVCDKKMLRKQVK